ncbi:hypothetical protein [Paenibacillus sp. NPDC058174]|uniref:hypothetical protein n=1 Tax=Paenibacillus sp. NPDC058174 TaxID=3346366 RepID=UPI0036DB14CC
MDIVKDNTGSSWLQQGFVVYPNAVTHFYVLRYLLWLIRGGTNAEYSTHHQSLWDIRMYEPVYNAFSEVLGNQALMVSLNPKETPNIQGMVCLQTETTIHKSGLRINMCDLIIFDVERCQLDLDSDFDSFWFPVTMIPANTFDEVALQERLQYWHAKPFRTHLSPLGSKLLGLESWEAGLPGAHA